MLVLQMQGYTFAFNVLVRIWKHREVYIVHVNDMRMTCYTTILSSIVS